MPLPELATVAAVDLQRYVGVWYEIARLPFRFEPTDATDVSATYTLEGEGKVKVQNRMRRGGEVQESVGQATVVDPSGAKLEVSFLPEGLRWVPFTKGDYWVIALDDDYSMSLVGTPDRKYLWLLSRITQPATALRERYLQLAREQGFDLGSLITTVHTDHPTA